MRGFNKRRLPTNRNSRKASSVRALCGDHYRIVDHYRVVDHYCIGAVRQVADEPDLKKVLKAELQKLEGSVPTQCNNNFFAEM